MPDVLQKFIKEKKKRKQNRMMSKKNVEEIYFECDECKASCRENKQHRDKISKTKSTQEEKAQVYQSIAATETIARGLAEKKKLVHSHYSHGMSNMNKLLTNVKIGNTTKLLKKKIRKKRKASSSLVVSSKRRSRRRSAVPPSTKKHVVEETPVKSRIVADTPIKSRVVLSTPVKSKCVAETPMKATSSEIPP